MDDIAVRTMRYQSSRVLGFSLHADPAADYYVHSQGDDVILMRARERLIAMSELKIAGLHNAANAIASLAMCEALELVTAGLFAGTA